MLSVGAKRKFILFVAFRKWRFD